MSERPRTVVEALRRTAREHGDLDAYVEIDRRLTFA